MPASLPRSTIWGLLALAPALIAAEGDGCEAAPEERPCASSQACGAAEYCTTETGTCNRPPGCEDGQGCATVCYGVCRPDVCRPQQVSFPLRHCIQLFQGFRWTGSACVETRGCPGTCQGADCDALYPDEDSCVATHRACPVAR
jgi:hypothetical protein